MRYLAAALAAVLSVLCVSAPAAAGDLPDARGVPWPGGPVRTVGKVVSFLPGGVDRLCSGALVDAPNGSVVATAAHCIKSPEDPQVPKETYFLPGYDDGPRTRSAIRKAGWRVRASRPAPGWDVDRPLARILPHDWGFLVLARRHGRTAQQTYGANRLRFGAAGHRGRPDRLLALGYPEAAPFDGETLQYCAGAVTVADGPKANAGDFVLSPCRLTQGSSGGPWLAGFDAHEGTGTVVAVTTVGESGTVMGRPFPAAARPVFRRASRL
jgi:V8-like Glu-specific endopeptidase